MANVEVSSELTVEQVELLLLRKRVELQRLLRERDRLQRAMEALDVAIRGMGGATDGEVVGAPSIVVAWDPSLVSPDEYQRLVVALGDLARADGAAGVVRVGSTGVGTPAGEAAA